MTDNRPIYKRHNHLYKLYCPDKRCRFKCYYCGLAAPTLDHVPSLANVDYILAADEKADFLKVPACNECNSLASDHCDFTIHERFIYLKEVFLTKYEKHFRLPLWYDEELKELDYTMQVYIQAAIDFRKFMVGRIIYGFASKEEAKHILNTHLLDY